MELLRWAVALTVYPFLLIDDLIHRHEDDDLIEYHRQLFIKQHEGE